VSGNMDMRDTEANAKKGDEGAKLALEIYCYKI